MRGALVAWGALALVVTVWWRGGEEDAAPDREVPTADLRGITTVDGLNAGPPEQLYAGDGIVAGAKLDWYTGSELERPLLDQLVDVWKHDWAAQWAGDDTGELRYITMSEVPPSAEELDEPGQDVSLESGVERAGDPDPVLPDREAHVIKGEVVEDFLELVAPVLRARDGDSLGGVAVAFDPGFDEIPTYPLVYVDWRAMRIDLHQRLVDGEPRVRRWYTNIGEFSVRGPVAFSTPDYEIVQVPGEMGAREPFRVRISERRVGKVDRFLVQVWREEPSRPERLKGTQE